MINGSSRGPLTARRAERRDARHWEQRGQRMALPSTVRAPVAVVALFASHHKAGSAREPSPNLMLEESPDPCASAARATEDLMSGTGGSLVFYASREGWARTHTGFLGLLSHVGLVRVSSDLKCPFRNKMHTSVGWIPEMLSPNFIHAVIRNARESDKGRSNLPASSTGHIPICLLIPKDKTADESCYEFNRFWNRSTWHLVSDPLNCFKSNKNLFYIFLVWHLGANVKRSLDSFLIYSPD